MLFATREILLEKLLHLPKLIDAYQRNDVDFVARAIDWLLDVEKSLSQLRSPLTSLVASQRSRIISAQNNYRESSLQGDKISRRKTVDITTSLALSEVESALVRQLQEIDDKFDLWREKLAQFISVASTSVAIPLPPTNPLREWLKQIWQSWQTLDETRAMYNYLNTVMSPNDRFQLLGELLENHLNGHSKTRTLS
jgi:hypothetical protein